VVTFPLGAFSICAGGSLEKHFRVGGQCEYRSYKGRGKIVSIAKKDGAKGYEVKFFFNPDEEVKEEFARTEGREFLLLPSNTLYPGPNFLKNHGFKVDGFFDCTLRVIIKGTCTPVLFEYPFIDPAEKVED
jgi:hypothetical protein